MKSLIAAALLLALTIPAHAQTCTGRVYVDVVTNNDGLLSKGDKIIRVGDCTILDDRVLRTCPKGSFCRVEGTDGGDEAINVTSVKRIRPYQEGVRDYRAGQCYRARPYTDSSPEQKLWERGYDAQAKKKPRDMSHCYGTRGEKH